MKTHMLIRALKKIMPQASFALTDSRDWCSLTFSGQQITIECYLTGQDSDQCSRYLTDIIPGYQFSIPGWLIADIAVVTRQECDSDITLVIETLVIFG